MRRTHYNIGYVIRLTYYNVRYVIRLTHYNIMYVIKLTHYNIGYVIRLTHYNVDYKRDLLMLSASVKSKDRYNGDDKRKPVAFCTMNTS